MLDASTAKPAPPKTTGFFGVEGSLSHGIKAPKPDKPLNDKFHQPESSKKKTRARSTTPQAKISRLWPLFTFLIPSQVGRHRLRH